MGRMLLQAAANYPVETYVLENDEQCPSAHLCHHFTKGDIKEFDAVYAFGKQLDAITIEIEAVNVDALEKLEQEGVTVYPKVAVIKTIRNKILQKEFYKKHSIPSPEFIITTSIEELRQKTTFFPAVHKIAEGGYDGRGVQVIRKEADAEKGFNAPSVLEKMVEIRKEISHIVAISANGETALYPSAEMIMDPVLNQLTYHISPSTLDEKILWKAEAIALRVAKELDSPGLFAIEMFVDRNDDVWVNETAPRVHNSGHHTIEANFCSQFDMLWRIILGYPLGNTDPILNAAMINVLGSEDANGEAKYEGLEDVLKIQNAFIHLYGKKQTKPGRKMGHVTIVSNERQELIHQAMRVTQTLKVIAL